MFNTHSNTSGLSTAAGFNADGSLIPGTVLSQLVQKYATLFSQPLDNAADSVEIMKTYKSDLFRDIVEFLRSHCVPNLSPSAFEKLNEAMPLLFNTIVTRQHIKKSSRGTAPLGIHQVSA